MIPSEQNNIEIFNKNKKKDEENKIKVDIYNHYDKNNINNYNEQNYYYYQNTIKKNDVIPNIINEPSLSPVT